MMRDFPEPARWRFALDRFQCTPSHRAYRAYLSKQGRAELRELRLDRPFAISGVICINSWVRKFPLVSKHLATVATSKPIDPCITPFERELYGAYRAECNPCKVACYPTRKDAERGREVVMSPGRFFAAAVPTRSASEVTALAEKFIAYDKPVEVFYAESADEWEAAYSRDTEFSSCMSYNSCVRFYACDGSPLRCAFITSNQKVGGDIVARCIVNIELKLAVRNYGDHRLVAALEALGYSFDEPSRAVKGVVCSAESDGDYLIAPYLDSSMQIEWDGDSDTCKIVSNGYGNYQGDSTSGFSESLDSGRRSCDRCGDRYDSDSEGAYIESEEYDVCDACLNRHYVSAIIGRRNGYNQEEYIQNDEAIEVNGNYYLNDSDVLSACGFVYSEWSSEWISEDSAVYLEYRSDYAPLGSCTLLDIEFDGDSYALDGDTMTVEVEGVERVVHHDWTAPEPDYAELVLCGART